MAELVICSPLEQRVMIQWRHLHDQSEIICSHFDKASSLHDAAEEALVNFGMSLVDILRDASWLREVTRPACPSALRPQRAAGHELRKSSAEINWPRAETGH